MGRGGSTLPPPKGGFSASELVDYYNNHRVKWTGRSFITHLRVGLVSHLEMTTREFCCCARLLPCQCGFFYLYTSGWAVVSLAPSRILARRSAKENICKASYRCIQRRLPYITKLTTRVCGKSLALEDCRQLITAVSALVASPAIVLSPLQEE